ncbi:MAG TPA: GntR family transcriptional regulator [Microbacterium sp.]|uniref:GntR family transcriptional regulator n=1 Tax=Microbacterium sp. TaxID=51671 RepID=UPI002B4AA02F|nr:GntR family transcriptional regulator [Microbacterium sp.]HKT56824.1 GntR family transcriptional regulator [Microbacterium sp.]
MQIEIDPLSDVALYQQLRDRVVEGIAGGELRVGDQLAPVRTLAAQFGINIATVGKAYDLLRSEGLVRTNRTSGSVVARAPHDDAEGTGPAALEGVGAWDGSARDAWVRRLATVLAEGVAQGEQDAAITATVDATLHAFSASRQHANDERKSQGGSADEH